MVGVFVVRPDATGRSHEFLQLRREKNDFMISGPVMIQVLEGEGAIAKNRELMYGQCRWLFRRQWNYNLNRQLGS